MDGDTVVFRGLLDFLSGVWNDACVDQMIEQIDEDSCGFVPEWKPSGSGFFHGVDGFPVHGHGAVDEIIRTE